MSGETLGFVGVGRMGGPMASRLLDAGHSLCVFDTSSAACDALANRGAEVCGSACEVADKVETVLLSLPTPDIVKAVVLGDDGIAHGGRVGTIVDLSTTGPSVAAEIGAAVIASGRTWVDSPVSGGVGGATKGTLGVMVSCPEATFPALEPILKNFGKVFYTGDKPGLAQTAKLCNNMLSIAGLVVTAETLAMGTKAGLDPKVLLDIINVSSGRNTATMDKFPRAVLPRTFDYAFSTGLAYKDVRLYVDEAEAIGVPMLVGAAVSQMMAVTNAKYGADSDFTVVAKLLEEWAGVEIKSKGNT